MFEKEYSFYGKHAVMVNLLKNSVDTNRKFRFFERNIDIYLVAPIIGLQCNKWIELDKSTKDTSKIFSDRLIKSSEEIKFNMQVVLLKHNEENSSLETRLEKAFKSKDLFIKEHREIFEGYVRGGIEVLYEGLLDQDLNSDEYEINLYQFLSFYKSKS